MKASKFGVSYRCLECAIEVKKKSELDLHMFPFHPRYRCPVPSCIQRFGKEKEIKTCPLTKIKKLETNSRYKCPDPGYSYSVIKSLHLGTRFSCPIPNCSSTVFPHKMALQYHYRTLKRHSKLVNRNSTLPYVKFFSSNK